MRQIMLSAFFVAALPLTASAQAAGPVTDTATDTTTDTAAPAPATTTTTIGAAPATSTIAAPPATGTPPATGATSATDIVNGQAFGDWLVRCDALGVNRTRCMLSQRVARSDDGAPLGEIMAFWSDDTPPAPILVAQAPVGLYLPTAFVLQPDGAPDDQRLEFIWQSCNPTICEAVSLPGQDKLDKLTGAQRLLAGYRATANAEATVFPISTKGLAEGLRALKSAQDKSAP